MAFVRKEWKDRIAEFAGRRRLADAYSGAEQVVDVSREEGFVSQAGDAFSAQNMNDLEQRVADGFGSCPESTDIRKISVVASLPSDAAAHADTLYIIPG